MFNLDISIVLFMEHHLQFFCYNTPNFDFKQRLHKLSKTISYNTKSTYVDTYVCMYTYMYIKVKNIFTRIMSLTHGNHLSCANKVPHMRYQMRCEQQNEFQ